MCPSGYNIQYGSYNGIGGQWYCVLEDPNARSCDTEPKPDKERGCDQAMEGNPCNVATGNKYQIETDFVGTGPFPLRIERHYNSDTGTPESDWGPQWRHFYDRKIEFSSGAPQNNYHTGPVIAYLRRPDGPVIAFVNDAATGKWNPRDTDTVGTLENFGDYWEYRGPDDTLETYHLYKEPYWWNVEGRLESIETRGGYEQTLTYSGDYLDTVTDQFDRTLEFSYDGNGRIQSVEDPYGRVYAYTYDTNGYLASVSYPDGTPADPNDNPIREYHYGDASHPGALTRLMNEEGDDNGIWSYDANRRAVSSERAGGVNRLDFTYNPDGTTSVAENGGETRVYSFDLINGVRRNSGISSSASSESAVHDARGYVESRTDRNGVRTDYTIDARGLETRRVEAGGTPEERTVDTVWHATLRVPVEITVGTRRTDFDYDTSGRLTEVTVTDTQSLAERTTALTYTTDGFISTIDGPRSDLSDVTTLTYDGFGNLATATNPAGHVTTYDAFDAAGRLLTMTDPNGLVTDYVYDERGRLVALTETPPAALSRTTSFTYDRLGQLTGVTLANGSTLSYTYTAARYLDSVEDNLGNRIEYDHDLRGNVIAEDTYDPSSTLRRNIDFVYDARNRLDTINAAGSITLFTYDADSNIEEIEDPNNYSTTYTHDPLDRIAQAVDALSGSTDTDYDVLDQIVQVTAPNGAVTDYTYDALGDLNSVSSPDTGITTYTHDTAGNVLTKTDANGNTTTYTYDALNRPLSASYANAALNVTFGYDNGAGQQGRLTSMTDGSGTSTYSHDVFGNLLQASRTINGNVHVTGYTYDPEDQLSSITYPSGRVVDYTRDGVGRIERVDTTYGATTENLADNVAYAPFGPLTALTHGNGLVMNRIFDAQYRLTALVTGTIQNVEFAYDDAGNIDSIIDIVTPGRSQTFTQDELHRIDSDAGAYGALAYTYDASGNRLTRTVNGSADQTLTYTSLSNRMATRGGSAVSIDSAGNTTSDPSLNLTFGYDDHNRLTIVSSSAGLLATYVYNGDGQRVVKIEASGNQETTVFHYGVSGELIGETVYNSGGVIVTERDYVWLGTMPIAQAEQTFSGGVLAAEAMSYLHTDQLHTPRLATNDLGTVVWRWDSDAFGVGAADSDPDLDLSDVHVRLRFPGQYWDDESGLAYNYFRTYDPSTGRFLESDPVGLIGGLNTFAYVESNPLIRVDPTGEYWRLVVEACKRVWKRIGPKSRTPKAKPKPSPARIKQCQDAFLACLNDFSIPESTCFAAHTTCVSTTGPMIFPGYGPIK